jgi:hypothetical protein
MMTYIKSLFRGDLRDSRLKRKAAKEANKARDLEFQIERDRYEDRLAKKDDELLKRDLEMVNYRKEVRGIVYNLQEDVAQIRKGLISFQEMDAQREGHLESIQKQIAIFSDKKENMQRKGTDLMNTIKQFGHKSHHSLHLIQ